MRVQKREAKPFAVHLGLLYTRDCKELNSPSNIGAITLSSAIRALMNPVM